MQPSSEPLASIANHVGATTSSPAGVVFHRAGRRFIVQATGGNRPVMTLTVSLEAEGQDAAKQNLFTDRGRPRLVLRRETNLDRFGKRWRINREVQTGDEMFDAIVYVETDDSEAHIRPLLESEAVRRATTELLEGGWVSVTIDGVGNSVVAVRRGAAVELFDPAWFDAAVTHLTQIATDIAPFQGVRQRRMPPGLWPVFGSFGMLLALPFLIWADNASLVRGWDTFVCIGTGTLSAVPMFAVFFVLMRGRATSMVSLLATLPVVVVMGTMVGGIGLKIVNARGDQSQPQERIVEAVSRRTETSDTGADTLYVSVRDWRDPSDQVELGVTKGIYERAVAGAKFKVVTRAGRLGWEWISGPVMLP